jgi:hypothetical protein
MHQNPRKKPEEEQKKTDAPTTLAQGSKKNPADAIIKSMAQTIRKSYADMVSNGLWTQQKADEILNKTFQNNTILSSLKH